MTQSCRQIFLSNELATSMHLGSEFLNLWHANLLYR
jgi:hypothetical protein